jgi:6-phosphogluconolactonase
MTLGRLRAQPALVLLLGAAVLAGCSSGRGGGGVSPAAASTTAARVPVYVGTYTGAGSRGIYRCELDPSSGELTPPVLVAESDNPSWLALRPDGRVLYAANELTSYQGEASGAVSAFAVDAVDGRLSLLGQRPSGGADPCYLAVDRAGRNLLLANYTGGSLAVLPLAADGRLLPASSFVQLAGRGPNEERQQGPHAHEIVLDPDERFALAADLGADRILVYRYDATRGTLEPSDPPALALPAGSGPRHLAWQPGGRHVYLISELASTVTVLRWDGGRGTLAAVQTVTTLPAGFAGTNTAAEVAVAADGRFLYASNRGDDSIAVLAVDASGGVLTPAGRVSAGGKAPRHLALDPSGDWLLVACQGSDSIAVFRIDRASGMPSPTGRRLALSRPVCVLLAGAGAPVTPR